MLIIWILLIVFFLIFIRLIYILWKRVLLLVKIRQKADETICIRNPLRSALIPDGKPDLLVKKENRWISVVVLTTPLKRVRYNFVDNQLLELILERKGVLVRPTKIAFAATINHSYRLIKYHITFEKKEDTTQFVILNPAPRIISRVSGSTMDFLFNGDSLFENIKVCGLKYFLEKVL